MQTQPGFDRPAGLGKGGQLTVLFDESGVDRGHNPIDVRSVDARLILNLLARGVPMLRQALLARARPQALAIPAAGQLNWGLTALGKLAQAQLAGYFQIPLHGRPLPSVRPTRSCALSSSYLMRVSQCEKPPVGEH
jgi:hypothetical protein